MIPSYPLRPTNGGPYSISRPKRGAWSYEPKVNGWRALVHAPTGKMWNRKGEPLSIEREFQAVLETLRNANLPPEMEWLDCEALERRHALGRGSLVILDYLAPNKATYKERRDKIITLQGASFLDHTSPIPNDSLLVLMEFGEDTHITAGEMWITLQNCNKKWNAEVFEGFVAKRHDSPYPRQLRSPDLETPFWIKHRWEF